VLLIGRISRSTQIARYQGTQEASTPIYELSFAAVPSSDTLYHDMAFVRLRSAFPLLLRTLRRHDNYSRVS